MASFFPRNSPSNDSIGGMDENMMMLLLEKARERVKREQGLPPAVLPPMSPELIIFSSQQSRENRDQAQSGEVAMRQTLMGDPKYCSEENLSQLQRIEIRDLQIRKVHRGHYLLCRVVTLPAEMVGLYFAVVSPSGNAIQLALYNFVVQPISLGLANPRTYDAALPIGTILAIKEPFVKIGSQGGLPFVRVDSPSDVIALSSADPLLRNISWKEVPSGTWLPPSQLRRSLLQWKNIGNDHFKARRFFEAEQCYSAGTAQHPNDGDCFLLDLNRAAVLLKLERYSEALLAAESVILHLDPDGSAKAEGPTTNVAKALYRKAVALYSLRQWKAAQKAFLRLSDCVSSSQEAASGLRSCEQRITEAKTGNYDFLSLFKQAQLPKPRPDVADFVGPVEVRIAAGKGRGIFATRDIKPGEILLAAKAFVAVFKADLPPESEWNMLSLNLLTNKGEHGYHAVIPRMVCYRLQHQPGAANQLYGLYDGQKARSTGYNLHSDFGGNENESSSPITIDPARIDAICSFNSFRLNTPTHVGFSPGHKAIDEGSGLFLQASLFNHSCFQNATWVCFGDFQVIKATVFITEGTEIFIPYIPEESLYAQRQAKLRDHFSVEKFKCDCERCKSDLADGLSNIRKREKFIEENGKPGKRNTLPGNSGVPQIRSFIRQQEKLIGDLDATFSQSRQLSVRPEIYPFHQQLARAYALLGIETRDGVLISKSKAEEMKGLQACGVQLRLQKKVNKSRPVSYLTPSTLPIASGPRYHRDMVISSTIQIASHCQGLGNKKEAKAWLQSAVWMQDITIGGGTEMFREQFGSMIKKLDLEKYLD